MIANLRRHLAQIGLGIAVVAFFLVHSTGNVSAPFIDRLEFIAYDTRLALTVPGGIDERIVIIDIDEKSLQAEGRWPWGREKMAKLVTNLFEEHQTGLLGFDVVFAEADESSGLGALEAMASGPLKDIPEFKATLDQMRPELDPDGKFAEVLARYPVVLGYYFSGALGADAIQSGLLPPPTFKGEVFEGRKMLIPVATGYGANLNRFQEVAYGAGHFSPEVDADGVVRKVPVVYEFDGNYYGALALSMAQLALPDKPPLTPGFPAGATASGVYPPMEWLQLGNLRIPVNERGMALVPYRGPQGSFRYVSATDVLNGNVPAGLLKGRMALVGTSAPGLNDLRSTPVGSVYSGVEIHANLLAGILDETIINDPAYTLGAEFILLLLSGFAMAVVLPILSPLSSTAAALGTLAAYTAVNFWVWSLESMVLELAPGLIMILALYLLNMSYGFFVESRGKRQLAGLFGQYIPPELVDEMSVDPASYSMAAQSRDLTVLFTDVRGFTTISEALDPQELSELMREFLTPMTAVIHRHRGTIDKYMGDAVMCFWGAPVNDPEHARHALEAAMDMLDCVHGLAPAFAARGWPPINIGIGLNTGDMSVGDMGSQFRRAYTVLGDAVNLGARLEGQTKSYGVELIVNETTRRAVPGFMYRELDRIRVKGKDEPVTIYEPLGRTEDVSDDDKAELKLYRQALALYRSQAWDNAEIQFVNLRSNYPERYLYELYIVRIADNRANPPEKDWDGVFTATSK